jgi:DNA-binding MarR family transcriptional regulator
MNNEETLGPDVSIEINRLVHEPVRLKILAYLSVVESADFVFLVSRIGLTMGNLSAHISKLSEAGYIEVQKDFKDNRPRTMLSITGEGKNAFITYREEMLRLLSE